MPPTSKFLTGLTNLDIVLDKNIPGKNLFLATLFLDDYSYFSCSSTSSSSIIEVGGK